MDLVVSKYLTGVQSVQHNEYKPLQIICTGEDNEYKKDDWWNHSARTDSYNTESYQS